MGMKATEWAVETPVIYKFLVIWQVGVWTVKLFAFAQKNGFSRQFMNLNRVLYKPDNTIRQLDSWIFEE